MVHSRAVVGVRCCFLVLTLYWKEEEEKQAQQAKGMERCRRYRLEIGCKKANHRPSKKKSKTATRLEDAIDDDDFARIRFQIGKKDVPCFVFSRERGMAAESDFKSKKTDISCFFSRRGEPISFRPASILLVAAGTTASHRCSAASVIHNNNTNNTVAGYDFGLSAVTFFAPSHFV